MDSINITDDTSENTNPIFNFSATEDSPKSVKDSDRAIPSKVQEVFKRFGLGNENFSCTLSRVEGDGSISYIEEYNREIPTVPLVGKRYGGGKYRLTFQWTVTQGDEQVPQSEDVDITISDAYNAIHEEYQEELAIQAELNTAKRLDKARRRREIKEEVRGKPKKDPEETFNSMIDQMVKIQAVMNPHGQRNGGVDWEKLIPFATVALQQMQESRANAQNQQTQMMMLMFQMMQENSKNMISLVTNQKPQNEGTNEIMNKVLETVLAGAQLKEALHPQKEGVVDKIMNMIEGVAPKLLEIASMPKAQAENTMSYKIADKYMKSSEEFQQMNKDSEILQNVVQRLDSQMGWYQTDQILKVTGYERPEELVGNRKTFKPFPEGDPRNDEYNQAQSDVADAEYSEEVQNASQSGDPNLSNHDEAIRRQQAGEKAFNPSVFNNSENDQDSDMEHFG